MIVSVSQTAAAAYLGTRITEKLVDKGVEILGKIIEGKLDQSDGAKKTVTIYGPDEQVARVVTVKPDKLPRQR